VAAFVHAQQAVEQNIGRRNVRSNSGQARLTAESDLDSVCPAVNPSDCSPMFTSDRLRGRSPW
jgi:hypothetical protein